MKKGAFGLVVVTFVFYFLFFFRSSSQATKLYIPSLQSHIQLGDVSSQNIPFEKFNCQPTSEGSKFCRFYLANGGSTLTLDLSIQNNSITAINLLGFGYDSDFLHETLFIAQAQSFYKKVVTKDFSRFSEHEKFMNTNDSEEMTLTFSANTKIKKLLSLSIYLRSV